MIIDLYLFSPNLGKSFKNLFAINYIHISNLLFCLTSLNSVLEKKRFNLKCYYQYSSIYVYIYMYIHYTYNHIDQGDCRLQSLYILSSARLFTASMILEKLNAYGVRGVASWLFKSYLSGRLQSISFNLESADRTRLLLGKMFRMILLLCLILSLLKGNRLVFVCTHRFLYLCQNQVQFEILLSFG